MGKKHPYSSPSEIDDIEFSAAARLPPHHLATHAPREPWTAWLVQTFAVGNAVAFALTMYVNNCPSTTRPEYCVLRFLGRFSFQPLSENPLFGPSFATLDQMGALDWKQVVMDGEGWRLFSCIWLHAGVIHLLANILSLLFTGIRLEQEFGFVRILILYTLSGFGGSLLSSLYPSLRSQISVGASGALFGLLGAMLSELIINWTIYANKFAALLTLLFIIAINLAVGLIPRVYSSAHIGGFVSGFLLGFVLLIRPQCGWVSHKHIPPGYDIGSIKPKYKVYQHLLWFIALVLLIFGFTGGLVKLFL